MLRSNEARGPLEPNATTTEPTRPGAGALQEKAPGEEHTRQPGAAATSRTRESPRGKEASAQPEINSVQENKTYASNKKNRQHTAARILSRGDGSPCTLKRCPHPPGTPAGHRGCFHFTGDTAEVPRSHALPCVSSKPQPSLSATTLPPWPQSPPSEKWGEARASPPEEPMG